MHDREIKEIELSITFGQRYMQYEEEILSYKAKTWDDNRKFDQYLQQDRSVIVQIVSALEQGTEVAPINFYKKLMTVVGVDFFKKEFKELKKLLDEPRTLSII